MPGCGSCCPDVLELDRCCLLDCEAAGCNAKVPCFLLGQDHAHRALSRPLMLLPPPPPLLLLLLQMVLLALLLAVLLPGLRASPLGTSHGPSQIGQGL